MSRARRRGLAAVWAGCAAGAPLTGHAQPPAAAAETATAPSPSSETAEAGDVEMYLAERGLRELLAAYLLQQLRDTEGVGRQAVADRLGRLYVEMFDRAPDDAARETWRARSEDLLRAVPEADSFDLRINLTKVAYLRAEDAAERWRLRLASQEEAQAAERELRAAAVAFQEIGTKTHRRVEALERREASGREEDTTGLRHLLADARRQRSLAMYYAGWSSYYVAMIADKPVGMDEALSSFGWLLNAGGGKPATVEKVSGNMLRYEHVARAAIGAALCESLRGNHETALRWLEAIHTADETPPTIRDQLPGRRMSVLGQARRWADLDTLVRHRRDRTVEGASGPGPHPLPLPEARLLAVVTLEALNGDVPRHVQDLVRRLAEGAMSDLITAGEVRHVLDLVTRYGTATLAGEGFIVNYVRGLQGYERARAAHAATGGDPEHPTADAATANAYRLASDSLAVAGASADAARFPDELANAGLLQGLALYYADELVAAAERLERVHATAASARQAEESLWLAIVALDRAIEKGRPSLRAQCDRLGALFLRTYPRTDRAARLLLRQAAAGLVSDEQAVEILLGVEPGSPVYAVARRHAANLLYGVYRRSRGNARDFAALRFAEIAEEVVAADRLEVEDKDPARSREATTRVITRVRQMLETLLGASAPDIERASRALQALEATAAFTGASLTDIADELEFRRLQIALAKADEKDARARLDALYARGGRWADSAARLMYTRAVKAFESRPDDAGAARQVVTHGQQVIRQFADDARALSDPAVYTLHNQVAHAAALVWRKESDQTMRDLAVRLDRGLLAASPTAPVLRRVAELAEGAGDPAASLDAWRQLLTGSAPESEAWYEARYHSLRLLDRLEPERAREAMQQHALLHPEYGPEPWGERLRELHRSMKDPAAQPPAPPAPPAGGGG